MPVPFRNMIFIKLSGAEVSGTAYGIYSIKILPKRQECSIVIFLSFRYIINVVKHRDLTDGLGYL